MIDRAPAPARLLVVDDNKVNRLLLTRNLELLGHRVATAENGRLALDLLRAEAFDLVLLDIGMPNVDGREVARRLRATAETKSTFLVAVTGFSPGDTTLDMSPTGFDARITKPLENEALLALIARVQQMKGG